MIKKYLFTSFFLSILLIFNVFAAGSSDSGSSKTKTQYDMAVSHINAAKKFEQKDHSHDPAGPPRRPFKKFKNLGRKCQLFLKF